MIARISYDLSNEDDRESFDLSVRAHDLRRALSEVASHINAKSDSLESDDPLFAGYDHMREEFWSIVNEWELGTIIS